VTLSQPLSQLSLLSPSGPEAAQARGLAPSSSGSHAAHCNSPCGRARTAPAAVLPWPGGCDERPARSGERKRRPARSTHEEVAAGGSSTVAGLRRLSQRRLAARAAPMAAGFSDPSDPAKAEAQAADPAMANAHTADAAMAHAQTPSDGGGRGDLAVCG
jgi:hypothetical protein